MEQHGELSSNSDDSAIALLDVKDHAFAVDIGHLEPAKFRVAHPGCIQRHDHRSMHEAAGGVDERATSS